MPCALVFNVISSSPNKLMGPAKLEKSTFCGPFNFNFPTGEDTNNEFPGPDLIFCVSMLWLNCIPPGSEKKIQSYYWIPIISTKYLISFKKSTFSNFPISSVSRKKLAI